MSFRVHPSNPAISSQYTRKRTPSQTMERIQGAAAQVAADCCVLRADGTLPHANAKAYNQSGGGTIHIQAVSMGKHRSKRTNDGLPQLAAAVCTHTSILRRGVLYATRNTLCAASRRGAARRSSRGGEAPGRFEVQPVYTSSAQRNLAGVYGGYTARTRSTGRGPSISHSIRSLASRLASSSPDATPMILGSPIALAGRAEFWCTRRVEVNVDSSG